MFNSPIPDSTDESPANRRQLAAADRAAAELLARALVRGFHGVVSVEMYVQDGTIQHVKRRLEQMEK